MAATLLNHQNLLWMMGLVFSFLNVAECGKGQSESKTNRPGNRLIVSFVMYLNF